MTALRAVVTVILMTGVAWADEPPCRADGDRVSCDKPSFDKLVKKLIDEKARADVLDVKLAEMTASRDDVTKAMLACESKPPVVLPPPAIPAWRTVMPVVLSAVGAAVLTTSVAIDIGATGRVTGAVVGLAAVGVGVVLALP